jgi:hypothetical protein
MAKRHIQQIDYAQALLQRTVEQLSAMFAFRNTHFGARQAPGFLIGADVQKGRSASPDHDDIVPARH